jgi:LemA protein
VGQIQVTPEMLDDPEAMRRFEEAQAQLTGALSRLLVVAEQYPQLRADQNFLALQSQLEGTENRIAVARRDYIQAVQRYNTEVRTFPGRFWAMVYGAEPKASFAAAPGAEQAPRVTF